MLKIASRQEPLLPVVRVHGCSFRSRKEKRDVRAWVFTMAMKLEKHLHSTVSQLPRLGGAAALSHSFNLSFTHSRHAEQLLFSCICSKVTFTLSHSHSFSLSHSFNLSFTHSWHAEQVLFSSLCSKVAVYSRKLQCFFGCFFLQPQHHPPLWV